MSQTWHRLTFLHWPYAPSAIPRFLPPGLTLDTFDNAAWIGLVPFVIHNLPGVPHFPETNVRTYVVGPDGSRAVWFFSLDAARLLAVAGARAAYHLPYFWAKMRVSTDDTAIQYHSRRVASSAATDIAIQLGERYRPEELTARDHFLTARYRLFTLRRGRLAHAQIHYERWQLVRATVLNLKENLLAAAGLPPSAGEPLVHYADHLDVRVGRLATLC